MTMIVNFWHKYMITNQFHNACRKKIYIPRIFQASTHDTNSFIADEMVI